ncbi:MAG: hypothetical protein WKG00_22375 [Polyangiaceae bacterium]
MLRAALLVTLAALFPACSHDWDAYDPLGATASGSAGSSSSSAGQGASGAGGSASGAGAGGADSGGAGGGPLVVWARSFGDAAAQEVRRVGVDGPGNVYAAGAFAGSVDFGGELVNAADGLDAFLVKLSPDGDVLWVRTWGGAGDDVVHGLAVTAQGDALVTGEFAATVTLAEVAYQSLGGPDAFVVRVDTGGQEVCGLAFGDEGEQRAASAAASTSGAFVISGMFGTALGLGTDPILSSGLLDLFVARLDESCKVEWVQSFGGSANDAAWSVASGADGAVLLGIDSGSAIDFGDGLLPNAGSGDIFIPKLDAGGGLDWVRHYGDAAAQWAPHMAVTSAGGVIGAGSFQGTVPFGNQVLQSADAYDAYVVQLDAAGAPVWSRVFGGAGSQFMHDAEVEADGNVLVIGYGEQTIDFGGGPVGGGGDLDVIVARLAADGSHLWSLGAGDSAAQRGNGVAAAPGGAIAIGGEFAGALTIDGVTLQSAGGTDAFVVKLAP